MNTKNRGLVLLAHGARNPDWAAPFEHMRHMVQQLLGGTPVKLAFLEFMPPDLPAAVQQLVPDGCTDITIVPLFLGQSGHVLRDLPPMLERLRQMHPGVALRLAKAAGDDADVQTAIAHYCMTALMTGDDPVKARNEA